MSNEVKSQLQRENPVIFIEEVERITPKTKGPATGIVFTTEGHDIPDTVIFDKKMPQPDNFVPKVLQCLRYFKTFHTKASCHMKEDICRYCSGRYPFRECQLAEKKTYFKKPNPTGKCANCLGQHGASFCRDATMKTRSTNITQQDARAQMRRQGTRTTSKLVQDQVTQLKEQVGKTSRETKQHPPS